MPTCNPNDARDADRLIAAIMQLLDCDGTMAETMVQHLTPYEIAESNRALARRGDGEFCTSVHDEPSPGTRCAYCGGHAVEDCDGRGEREGTCDALWGKGGKP